MQRDASPSFPVSSNTEGKKTPQTNKNPRHASHFFSLSSLNTWHVSECSESDSDHSPAVTRLHVTRKNLAITILIVITVLKHHNMKIINKRSNELYFLHSLSLSVKNTGCFPVLIWNEAMIVLHTASSHLPYSPSAVLIKHKEFWFDLTQHPEIFWRTMSEV